MKTFIDMFCGMGTIRMGFEQAGWECVYSIEWDKHKRRIYNVIFGNEPEGSDIRAVRHDDIPYADCWCFGAPCQDFSIAGKREGLDGDRSSLVREVFRLIRETPEEHRPTWLLYENVKGMLSSNKGLDFFEILFEMESLGYDIEWQLINSKWYVPQNRERVFTLGHLRGRSGRKIFPIGESCAGVNKSNGQTSQTCIAPTIDTRVGAGTHRSPYVLKQVMPGSDAQRVYDSDGIARTLKAEGGGQGAKTGLYMIRACLTPDRKEKRQNGRRFKEPGEPMFTLTKQDIHGVMVSGVYTNPSKDFIRPPMPNISKCIKAENHDAGVMLGSRIRRLTPRECMRLQGVPDEVTDKLIKAGISDTQMYRAAGDATTVNVLYEIAKRLVI